MFINLLLVKAHKIGIGIGHFENASQSIIIRKPPTQHLNNEANIFILQGFQVPRGEEIGQ